MLFLFQTISLLFLSHSRRFVYIWIERFSNQINSINQCCQHIDYFSLSFTYQFDTSMVLGSNTKVITFQKFFLNFINMKIQRPADLLNVCRTCLNELASERTSIYEKIEINTSDNCDVGDRLKIRILDAILLCTSNISVNICFIA